MNKRFPFVPNKLLHGHQLGFFDILHCYLALIPSGERHCTNLLHSSRVYLDPFWYIL